MHLWVVWVETLAVCWLATGISDWKDVKNPLAPTTQGPGFFDSLKNKHANSSLKQRFKNWKAKPTVFGNDTTGKPGDGQVSAEERAALRTEKKPGLKGKMARKMGTQKLNRYLRSGQSRLARSLSPDPLRERLLEGARLELRCPGLNRSALIPFKWELDGQRIPRKGRARFKIDRHSRNLIIRPILAADSGHYECYQWTAVPSGEGSEFRYMGQLTLEIRPLNGALVDGLLNYALCAGYAFLLFLLWVPLYVFCIFRPSERGLSKEDEAEHHAFLKDHFHQHNGPGNEERSQLPTERKSEMGSARSAVNFVRELEQSRVG